MKPFPHRPRLAYTCWIITLVSIPVLLRAAEPGEITGLPLDQARICVTGFDHNRPDPFPGLGDFIGWVGGVKKLADGDLLFVHSAGYWHVSFAMPMVLKEDLVEPYRKAGFDLPCLLGRRFLPADYYVERVAGFD